jgi:predicted GNAT family N-acyltransferase
MSGYRTKSVSFQTAEDGIRSVRERVFVNEQHVPLELEWDGLDESASHVIAVDEQGAVIGTGRLLADGHIGRMAVIQPWRQQGVGSALLQALCTLAENQGLQDVFLSAQTHAVGFYRRHGFVVHGDEFLDAGIPHLNMRRRLVK